MILDPTISMGGIKLRENGHLELERFSQTSACLEK